MLTQFVIVPTSMWNEPLHHLTGKNLTWAFLGYSDWFQILLGCLEFVPAFFLLFKRTSFWASVLLFPMTLAVSLINLSHHLWFETQILSGVLLLLNVLLFVYESAKIKQVLLIGFGNEKPQKRWWLELALGLCITLVLSLYAYSLLSEYKNDSNLLTGDWYHQKPIEWQLLDTANSKTRYSLYFMPFGSLEEQVDTAHNFDQKYYELDEKQHTLVFKDMQTDNVLVEYEFSVIDDKLTLCTNNKPCSVFVRTIINQHK